MAFQVVPSSFFSHVSKRCHSQNNNISSGYNEYRLGCYCLETNEKCRNVLSFLTLDGMFSLMANIQIFHHDALMSFGHKYVETFDELMDEIVYPIYLKRFSRKHFFLQNITFSQNSQLEKLKKEDDCKNVRNVVHDCILVLKRFDDTLNKFYRKFSVLNKFFRNDGDSSQVIGINNYGTLLANMNFQLDPNPTKGKQLYVTYSQLQFELTKLLDRIIPSHNVPFTEFFGLLGYSDVLGSEEITSKIETSNVKSRNCSLFKETNGSKCANSDFITGSHELNSFDAVEEKDQLCDHGMFQQYWRKYMQSLVHLLKLEADIYRKGISNLLYF